MVCSHQACLADSATVRFAADGTVTEAGFWVLDAHNGCCHGLRCWSWGMA